MESLFDFCINQRGVNTVLKKKSYFNSGLGKLNFAHFGASKTKYNLKFSNKKIIWEF